MRILAAEVLPSPGGVQAIGGAFGLVALACFCSRRPEGGVGVGARGLDLLGGASTKGVCLPP